MNSCGQYLNWVQSSVNTSPQQFVAWSYVKNQQLSLWWNSTLSAKQKCVGKKHFHITQHLCPNCCPNNADQLSPQLPQIQPIDAALLAAVKSKSDAYHSVVSTSPVLYLTHPSSQPPRRPLTLNLPCPPNPEKKRRTRGQGEPPDHQTRPISASPAWDQPASHRRWV